MTGLAWGPLLRLGLRRLRLKPEEFWALTPAELQIMLGDPGAGGPMLSAGLEAMMAAYPDEQEGNDDE
ncbi:rcc01693 family protein [Sulfitobacter sp. LCG007]